MATAPTITSEEIERKFIETLEEAGPSGLQIGNRNFAVSLCVCLGYDLVERERVLRVVNTITLNKSRFRVTYEGNPIRIIGSQGQPSTIPAYRVFKKASD